MDLAKQGSEGSRYLADGNHIGRDVRRRGIRREHHTRAGTLITSRCTCYRNYMVLQLGFKTDPQNTRDQFRAVASLNEMLTLASVDEYQQRRLVERICVQSPM